MELGGTVDRRKETAMGWDGIADNTRGHKRKFKEAAERVKEAAGSVDFGLKDGWLDCSCCAHALQDATGADCWDEHGWSAEKVKQLARSAQWPEDTPDEDKWAVLSAKAFLETCAEIGTGIHFSW